MALSGPTLVCTTVTMAVANAALAVAFGTVVTNGSIVMQNGQTAYGFRGRLTARLGNISPVVITTTLNGATMTMSLKPGETTGDLIDCDLAAIQASGAITDFLHISGCH